MIYSIFVGFGILFIIFVVIFLAVQPRRIAMNREGKKRIREQSKAPGATNSDHSKTK